MVRDLVARVIVRVNLDESQGVVKQVLQHPVIRMDERIAFSLEVVEANRLVVGRLPPADSGVCIRVGILVAGIIIRSAYPFQ